MKIINDILIQVKGSELNHFDIFDNYFKNDTDYSIFSDGSIFEYGQTMPTVRASALTASIYTSLRPVCAWCQAERGEAPKQGQSHGICERHIAQLQAELNSMTIEERIENEKCRRGEL